MKLQKAFSVMELIICVSIVATVAAILSPVFSKGIYVAKRSKDENSLRQIGIACLMYQDTYDGYVPHWQALNAGSPLREDLTSFALDPYPIGLLTTRYQEWGPSLDEAKPRQRVSVFFGTEKIFFEANEQMEVRTQRPNFGIVATMRGKPHPDSPTAYQFLFGEVSRFTTSGAIVRRNYSMRSVNGRNCLFEQDIFFDLAPEEDRVRCDQQWNSQP